MNSVSIRKMGLALILGATVGSLVACGEEEKTQNFRGFRDDKVRPGMSSIEAKKIKQNKGSGAVEAAAPDDQKTLALPQLAETDFITSEKHRDPFFPFVEVIGVQRAERRVVQRDIKLEEYDIADLKLIAIITKIGDPRAMVETPDGTGFVIRRGDYVGRADFVSQAGMGSEQIQVNWRVARIHGSGKEEERGVYFVRDDPSTRKGVDMHRFLPLHPRE